MIHFRLQCAITVIVLCQWSAVNATDESKPTTLTVNVGQTDESKDTEKGDQEKPDSPALKAMRELASKCRFQMAPEGKPAELTLKSEKNHCSNTPTKPLTSLRRPCGSGWMARSPPSFKRSKSTIVAAEVCGRIALQMPIQALLHVAGARGQRIQSRQNR